MKSLILENPTPRQLPDYVVDGGKRSELWFDGEQPLPNRERDGTLHFPWRPNMMFIPIRDGTQFAVRYAGPESGFHPLNGTTFFAGMDESPFVSRISDTVFDVLKWSGEDAFFYELKPDAIKLMEQLHGDNGRTTVRQGDIWYHKAGRSWGDLLEEQENHGKRSLRDGNLKTVYDKGTANLFRGVRHRISGRRLEGESLHIDKFDLNRVVVAEGVLSAPDHENKIAHPGPHVFARTPHLLPPPQLTIIDRFGLVLRSAGDLLWD